MKVIMLIMIVFVFNFIAPVDTVESEVSIGNFEMDIVFEDRVMYGAELPDYTNIKDTVKVTEIGNIPLRLQTGLGCGPVSLAMYMDWIGQPYRNQQFYDECAGRDEGETIKLYQLLLCGNDLGVKFIEERNYEVTDLQTGDMVIYHWAGYVNDTDLHLSVVDSIDNEIIRIANPWNTYDEYDINKFDKIFTGEALIAKK